MRYDDMQFDSGLYPVLILNIILVRFGRRCTLVRVDSRYVFDHVVDDYERFCWQNFYLRPCRAGFVFAVLIREKAEAS